MKADIVDGNVAHGRSLAPADTDIIHADLFDTFRKRHSEATIGKHFIARLIGAVVNPGNGQVRIQKVQHWHEDIGRQLEPSITSGSTSPALP